MTAIKISVCALDDTTPMDASKPPISAFFHRSHARLIILHISKVACKLLRIKLIMSCDRRDRTNSARTDLAGLDWLHALRLHAGAYTKVCTASVTARILLLLCPTLHTISATRTRTICSSMVEKAAVCDLASDGDAFRLAQPLLAF